jgi:hypothetical protein
MMAKYRVYYEVVASASIEVEADDPTEAMDKADDMFDIGPSLCAHCALGLGSGPAIDLGGWEPSEGLPDEVS